MNALEMNQNHIPYSKWKYGKYHTQIALKKLRGLDNPNLKEQLYAKHTKQLKVLCRVGKKV